MRIATKFALPQAVADDDDVAAVGGVFLGREGAAEDDGRAEEAKYRSVDVDAVDLLRVIAGDIEAGAAEVVGGDVLKTLVCCCQAWNSVTEATGAVALGRGVHEPDDAVWRRGR